MYVANEAQKITHFFALSSRLLLTLFVAIVRFEPTSGDQTSEHERYKDEQNVTMRYSKNLPTMFAFWYNHTMIFASVNVGYTCPTVGTL